MWPSPEDNVTGTPWGNFLQIGTNVYLDSTTNWFNFGGERSRWEVTASFLSATYIIWSKAVLDSWVTLLENEPGQKWMLTATGDSNSQNWANTILPALTHSWPQLYSGKTNVCDEDKVEKEEVEDGSNASKHEQGKEGRREGSQPFGRRWNETWRESAVGRQADWWRRRCSWVLQCQLMMYLHTL